MATVGYARVSSAGQSLEVQLEQLQAAGCSRVFQEKRSGTTTEGREQLAQALDWVREGDILLVTRLDRLARSITDLKAILARLEAKGVGFRALQQGAIDTTTSHGKLLLNILGSFAEFEADLRKERQMDGIAKAKAAGVYEGRGRPKSAPVDEIRRLKAEGVRPAHIAKQLGIARSTVYEVLSGGDATGEATEREER